MEAVKNHCKNKSTASMKACKSCARISHRTPRHVPTTPSTQQSWALCDMRCVFCPTRHSRHATQTVHWSYTSCGAYCGLPVAFPTWQAKQQGQQSMSSWHPRIHGMSFAASTTCRPCHKGWRALLIWMQRIRPEHPGCLQKRLAALLRQKLRMPTVSRILAT